MNQARLIESGGRVVEQGDPYRDLFEREFGKMRALARFLGADDPENVAQEAFVRVHAKLPRLRDPESAAAYLRVTVVNLTRSRISHLMVARRHLRSVQSIGAATGQQASAEDEVLLSFDREATLTALQQLSPRHREALVLRFWSDLSVAEVADAMGTSVGTAKSQLSRGIAALRILMEAHR